MPRQQNVSYERYRFSVPKADESVNQWIDAQGNLSHSIRELVRDYIRKHGITDATCVPVEQQARIGRPPKSEIKQDIETESESAQQERETIQNIPQVHQEPQTMPQPTMGRKITIPIVDGTEKGLQGVTMGNDSNSEEEPMMDMTAMMAGGGN